MSDYLIYDESIVKLSKGSFKPTDTALLFACMGSEYIDICDSIFGDEEVSSKMVLNIILNFIADTEGYDMLDVKKLIKMPKLYWDKWDELIGKKYDIPTSNELNEMFGLEK